jgi:hypothetical protein
MICRSRCLLIGLLALVLAVPPVPAAPRSQEDRETAEEDTDWSQSLLKLFPLLLEPLDCLLFGDCSPGIDPNGTSGLAASGIKESGPKLPEVPEAVSQKSQNSQ